MWFARIAKTRTLAQKLISGGKVRVDRKKVSGSSYPVSVGNVLTITLDRQILIYEIVALGSRRGPYTQAKDLYVDLSPVLETKTTDNKLTMQPGFVSQGRPDTWQRRQLRKFKNTDKR